MVHGFGSDRHANGRFVCLADALANKGFSTLAFDLSGCGESDPAACTLESFATIFKPP
jgi:putative redox protein